MPRQSMQSRLPHQDRNYESTYAALDSYEDRVTYEASSRSVASRLETFANNIGRSCKNMEMSKELFHGPVKGFDDFHPEIRILREQLLE